MIDKPIISIIAAMDKNQGIGYKNQLPWNIPDDLKRFKQLTLGHPVIMGRKTFESIVKYLNKPLPGRTNIIITSDKNFQYPDCIIVHSLDEAIDKASEINNNEIFIIGGFSIYQQAINLADKLYLTVINKTYKVDTYFPDFARFNKVNSSQKKSDGDLEYNYLILTRSA